MLRYKQDERGAYELFDDENGETVSISARIGILFDRRCSVLLKHGLPSRVMQIHADMDSNYRSSGLGEVADDLVYFEGGFDIEDLNRCLSICDYVGRLYDRLHPGKMGILLGT